MAQTGFTPILIYSSSTASNVPAAGSLTNSTLGSELAINITDGKLFYKDNANNVQVIGWKTVPISAGGTGLTSYAQGDLLYYNTGTTLTALAKNTTASRYLSNTGANNNPAWAQVDLTNGVTGDLPYSNLAQGSALSVLGVTGNATADVASIAAASDHQVLRRSGTSVAFGAVNLASTNAVTGTLPVGNGGTGNTTGAATAVKSNATTGLMEIVGPGAGTTRVMTIPDANFTVARTDATNTFSAVQLFPNGTAAAPALAPSADTDTGIYFGSNIVNVATNGGLSAQIDGARLIMGGARNESASFAARYPATLWFWGDTSFLSYSVRMMYYKENVSTGVAFAVFDISKAAGSATSTEIGQLGGVIRISSSLQVSGGVNIAEFVEIPFSLGCVGTNNIALATGTQRIVTSVNNTGGGAGAYALSLTGASNTAATLQVTVTRSGLLNNHLGIEMDAIASCNAATRLMLVARN